jgi:hypothetical protein
METIEEVLKAVGLGLTKYDSNLKKPIKTDKGSFTPKSLVDHLITELGREISKVSGDLDLYDPALVEQAIVELAEKRGVLKGVQPQLPDGFAELELCVDPATNEFFVVKGDRLYPRMSGEAYISLAQLSKAEAYAKATACMRQYNPRMASGIGSVRLSGEEVRIFNTYLAPPWRSYTGKLPDRLPKEFEKIVNHVIPLEIEREYFYSWLHASVFKRAPVFLVLCGAPGVGKNTLCSFITALHGEDNSGSGKQSTIKSAFNSALENNTFLFFDEVGYSVDDLKRMKEFPNATTSIENKGKDQKSRSYIYGSYVITNNVDTDNPLTFTDRKFAPLVLNGDSLTNVMSGEEIADITLRLSEGSEKFDVTLTAQIGRWLEKHGESNKWPNYEYKGPMFWRLANENMPVSYRTITDHLTNTDLSRFNCDPELGYDLLEVTRNISRKNNGSRFIMPSLPKLKAFLDCHRDYYGRKIFKATYDGAKDGGRFFVKIDKEGLEEKKPLKDESDTDLL